MKLSFRGTPYLVLVTAMLLGSVGQQNKLMAQSDDKTLLGAGSTFIYPLFSKMFSEYNQKTGIQVNYQSIGSGGGILQLTNKTVDFGD
jgi:ABC-type phosphate transport system substrate-binding protein